MKAVMMSFRPNWVEKIASGKKTVDVRKFVPKCGTPFKVYMYCTNDRKEILCVAQGGLAKKGDLYLNGNIHYPYTHGTLNGKVVGEFVCDEVFSFENSWFDKGFLRAIHDGHIHPEELALYLGKNNGCGLHISDLKLYDKPKELSEFRKPCIVKFNAYGCCGCVFEIKFPLDNFDFSKSECSDDTRIITRPPQSWCYVEEFDEAYITS